MTKPTQTEYRLVYNLWDAEGDPIRGEEGQVITERRIPGDPSALYEVEKKALAAAAERFGEAQVDPTLVEFQTAEQAGNCGQPAEPTVVVNVHIS